MKLSPANIIRWIRCVIVVCAGSGFFYCWLRFDVMTVPSGFDGAGIHSGAKIVVDTFFDPTGRQARLISSDPTNSLLVLLRLEVEGRADAVYPTLLVGLPGDAVEVANGRLTINGVLRRTLGGGVDFARRQIPDGKVFVINSNPQSGLPDSLNLQTFFDAERIGGRLIMALGN